MAATAARRVQFRLLKLLSRCPGLLLVGVYRSPLKAHSGRPPSGVRVSLAKPLELLPYAQRPEYDLSAKFLHEAAERDDVCVVTHIANELVAYGWVAYGTAPHVDGISVRFARGHRYSYKALTLPAFRGRQLRGSFGVLADRDTLEEVTHSLCFIDVNNTASMRAEHRNGGRLVGYAGYVRLAGAMAAFRSPGAKRFGFAFEPPRDDPD